MFHRCGERESCFKAFRDSCFVVAAERVYVLRKSHARKWKAVHTDHKQGHRLARARKSQTETIQTTGRNSGSVHLHS
jgi:hypothetical protein